MHMKTKKNRAHHKFSEIRWRELFARVCINLTFIHLSSVRHSFTLLDRWSPLYKCIRRIQKEFCTHKFLSQGQEGNSRICACVCITTSFDKRTIMVTYVDKWPNTTRITTRLWVITFPIKALKKKKLSDIHHSQELWSAITNHKCYKLCGWIQQTEKETWIKYKINFFP